MSVWDAMARLTGCESESVSGSEEEHVRRMFHFISYIRRCVCEKSNWSKSIWSDVVLLVFLSCCIICTYNLHVHHACVVKHFTCVLHHFIYLFKTCTTNKEIPCLNLGTCVFFFIYFRCSKIHTPRLWLHPTSCHSLPPASADFPLAVAAAITLSSPDADARRRFSIRTKMLTLTMKFFFFFSNA